MHSKEQIIASFDVFGRSLLQCSQLGLIFNINFFLLFKNTIFMDSKNRPDLK
ncbi:MAG: hypothetical protein ACJA1D_000861 [Polaribacter sp.]